jgi:hypothetical protein
MPALRKQHRVLRLVVMLLVAWLAPAYFLLPVAWRLAGRCHPALEDMPCVLAPTSTPSGTSCWVT